MRTLLAACVAFGAVSVAALPQARADDVRIGIPGAHLDIGGHDRDREAREYREHDREAREYRDRDWNRHGYEHRNREIVRERCVGPGCR
jgi:hypothetical protein